MITVFQWLKTWRINWKHENPGPWDRLAFILSWMRKLLASTGAGEVVRLCQPMFMTCLYFTKLCCQENDASLLVAARPANKTRTLRMCGILTPATARYVMCGFHFLIWKRGRWSPSSCQCRVKPVTVVCDREQAWLPSNSHRPCPLPCQHMGALYVQQPSDSALRILQKNFLQLPQIKYYLIHTHMYIWMTWAIYVYVYLLDVYLFDCIQSYFIWNMWYLKISYVFTWYFLKTLNQSWEVGKSH